MSRELKFRNWKNGFSYLDLLEDNDNDFYEFYRYGDYIIEQYTGLKDKNGKEIYEGDIISEISDLGEDCIYHFDYVVYWDNDTLCWSIKCISGNSWHNDLWETNSSREIIGNIHENPELLGGEK